MPIDPTKPVDGAPAEKADLRANLQAILDAIQPKVITSAGTSITVNAATFGDAQLVILRCTSGSSVTVTGADNVPEGRMLIAARKGNGNVTLTANTFSKPTSVTAVTTELHESLTAVVEGNVGGDAAEWWLLGRPA